MPEIERVFFVDSISTNQVQLRRVAGLTFTPDAHPGQSMHQITVTTGAGAVANADTGFWQANCTRYKVTISRMS